MSETKLYDLDVRGYPDKRGDVFRSLQVFECWVCGARTNRVVMGGWPGYGVRAVCPHAAECWHHDIEDKMRLGAAPHPKAYLEALQAEIDELKARHADKVTHDIEGEPDLTKKRGVTNVRARKLDGGCRHGF